MTTRKTTKDTESTTSEVAQEVLDEKGTQDNTFTAEVLG